MILQTIIINIFCRLETHILENSIDIFFILILIILLINPNK